VDVKGIKNCSLFKASQSVIDDWTRTNELFPIVLVGISSVRIVIQWTCSPSEMCDGAERWM
jgi:hypothetical protein